MIGCLRTRVRKRPIIALYFESENELKFYNLEAKCNTKLVIPFLFYQKALVNPSEINRFINDYYNDIRYSV